MIIVQIAEIVREILGVTGLPVAGQWRKGLWFSVCNVYFRSLSFKFHVLHEGGRLCVTLRVCPTAQVRPSRETTQILASGVLHCRGMGSGSLPSQHLCVIFLVPIMEPSLFSLAPSKPFTSLCAPQDFGITSLVNLGFRGSQEEGALLNLRLPTCSTNLAELKGHRKLGFLLKRGRIVQQGGEYIENEIQILIIMSINYLNHNPIHPLNFGFRWVTHLDKLSLP